MARTWRFPFSFVCAVSAHQARASLCRVRQPQADRPDRTCADIGYEWH